MNGQKKEETGGESTIKSVITQMLIYIPFSPTGHFPVLREIRVQAENHSPSIHLRSQRVESEASRAAGS